MTWQLSPPPDTTVYALPKTTRQRFVLLYLVWPHNHLRWSPNLCSFFQDLEGIREVISPTYSPEPTLELDLPSGNVRELTECFSAFSYRRPSLDPLDQDIDISAEVAENAAFDSEAADSYWANAHAQAKQLWRGISTGGASEAGTRTSDSDTGQ